MASALKHGTMAFLTGRQLDLCMSRCVTMVRLAFGPVTCMQSHACFSMDMRQRRQQVMTWHSNLECIHAFTQLGRDHPYMDGTCSILRYSRWQEGCCQYYISHCTKVSRPIEDMQALTGLSKSYTSFLGRPGDVQPMMPSMRLTSVTMTASLGRPIILNLHEH